MLFQDYYLKINILHKPASVCDILQGKLWKESLITDGQQFHQYQQNEQPPLA